MNFDSNSRFFITGGTGLVGSHFLFSLSEKYKIKALTRNPKRCAQVKSLFEYYDPENFESRWANIEWVQGDLNDIPQLEEEVKGSDYVIHAAAFVSFQRRDFNELLRINFEGTRNLINVCLVSNIKKFLHISSVSVFGKPENGNMITENNKWKNSPENSGYANSKYLAEREVWRGFEEGLDGVIVNPSIIFGPGNPMESSNKLFSNVLKGSKYYPPGGNAFVDVRDVVDASIQLLEKDIHKEQFILNALNTSYKNIFEQIAKRGGIHSPSKTITRGMTRMIYFTETMLKLFGRKQKLTKENIRSMFKTSLFDGSKVESSIGFKYRDMDETIENSIQYFRKKKLL